MIFFKAKYGSSKIKTRSRHKSKLYRLLKSILGASKTFNKSDNFGRNTIYNILVESAIISNKTLTYLIIMIKGFRLKNSRRNMIFSLKYVIKSLTGILFLNTSLYDSE